MLDASILGDPGVVSRAGRKDATKVFIHGGKSPWIPTLTGLFPNGQANAGSWLGKKKCFVLLCSIGEQFLLSSFREFLHDGYQHCYYRCAGSTSDLRRSTWNLERLYVVTYSRARHSKSPLFFSNSLVGYAILKDFSYLFGGKFTGRKFCRWRHDNNPRSIYSKNSTMSP